MSSNVMVITDEDKASLSSHMTEHVQGLLVAGVPVSPPTAPGWPCDDDCDDWFW